MDSLFENIFEKTAKWKRYNQLPSPSSQLYVDPYNKLTNGFSLQSHSNILYETKENMGNQNIYRNKTVFLDIPETKSTWSHKIGPKLSTLVVNVKNLSGLTLKKTTLEKLVTNAVVKKELSLTVTNKEENIANLKKENLVKANIVKNLNLENLTENFMEDTMGDVVSCMLDFNDLSNFDETLFEGKTLLKFQYFLSSQDSY